MQHQKWNQGDIRVDHQASSKDSFFARYSIQNTETQCPEHFPAVAFPGLSKPINLGDEDSFAGTAFQPAQHAVFSYVRVISPRLVNEFRMGFNRFRADYTADQYEPGAGLGNQFGIAELERNSERAELSNLLAIKLFRYRPDTFAAYLPTREHIPVHRQHEHDGRASTR